MVRRIFPVSGQKGRSTGGSATAFPRVMREYPGCQSGDMSYGGIPSPSGHGSIATGRKEALHLTSLTVTRRESIAQVGAEVFFFDLTYPILILSFTT